MRMSLVAIAVATVPPFVHAFADNPELPTGETIVERNIEAVGGHANLEKTMYEWSESWIEVDAFNVAAVFTTYRKGVLYRHFADVEGYGRVEVGCDGIDCWQLGGGLPPHLYEGVERERALAMTRLRAWEYDGWYSDIESAGIEDVEGEPCYVVVWHPLLDYEPITLYYSTRTYLCLKSATTEGTEERPITRESYYYDLRNVEGVVTPFEVVQKHDGVVFRREIYRFKKFGVEFEDEQFIPPPEIQALLDESDGVAPNSR